MSDARHRSPPAAAVAAVQIVQIVAKDVDEARFLGGVYRRRVVVERAALINM
jgi:hypothetical protein